MTNFNLTQQRIKFPWHIKPQGIVEFNAIIELFDEPVLLIERTKGIIWGANPSFAKLANCDPKELIGQKASSLFAEIEEKVLPIAENDRAVLLRKMKEALSVNLLARSIEANQQLYLLKVTQDAEVDLQRTRKQELVVRALTRLANLSIDGDFIEELHEAGSAIQATVEASNLCFYQADAANPRLLKLVEIGETSIFPESVSSTNLIPLIQNDHLAIGQTADGRNPSSRARSWDAICRIGRVGSTGPFVWFVGRSRPAGTVCAYRYAVGSARRANDTFH